MKIDKAGIKRGDYLIGGDCPGGFVSRKSAAKGDFVISDSGSQVSIKTRPKSSLEDVLQKMEKAREHALQIAKALRENRGAG